METCWYARHMTTDIAYDAVIYWGQSNDDMATDGPTWCLWIVPNTWGA